MNATQLKKRLSTGEYDDDGRGYEHDERQHDDNEYDAFNDERRKNDESNDANDAK